MTDGRIEWLESRVEKLQKAEIEARNRIIYATIQFEEDQKNYRCGLKMMEYYWQSTNWKRSD
jgi:hypothetical protein